MKCLNYWPMSPKPMTLKASHFKVINIFTIRILLIDNRVIMLEPDLFHSFFLGLMMKSIYTYNILHDERSVAQR